MTDRYVAIDSPISWSPDSFRCLSHHGILGQKWGVRRYQNPDGSLTTAGEKRYSSSADGKQVGNSKRSTGFRSIATKGTSLATKGSNKVKRSQKPDKDKVEQWLKENYVGYKAKPEYLQREIDYLNTYSDYDGLTVGERMYLDAVEEDELDKMSPEERRKYLEKLRQRQMDYLHKNVTTDGYKTDHADGRYNLVDKIREQFTGKLDADNVSSTKNSIVESRRGMLVATHKWSEEQEAVLERAFTQERLDRTLSKMQNSTLRKRGEKVVNKLLSGLRR